MRNRLFYAATALLVMLLTATSAWADSLGALTLGNNTVAFVSSQDVIYTFTPAANGDYRFYTNDPGLDTKITILHGDDYIGSDDDSGYERNFDCTVTLTGGATYTLVFRSFNGSTSITVTIEKVDTNTPDPNPNPNPDPDPTPTALALGDNTVSFTEGQTVTATFMPTRNGYYRFFSTGNVVSTQITVKDGNTTIEPSSNGSDEYNFDIVTVLTGGTTYTLELYSNSGTADVTVTIQKNLSPLPPFLSPGDNTIPFTENTQVRSSFTPAVSGQYRFTSTGTTVDPEIFIRNLDRTYSLITSDDNSGDGNNFDCTVTLISGTTYVLDFYSHAGTDDVTVNIAKVDDTNLYLGTNKVTLTQGQTVTLTFITDPEPSVYRFYSTGSVVNPRIAILKTGNQVVADDNGGDGNNFDCSAFLDYYSTYQVELSSNSGSGEVTVIVEKIVAFTQSGDTYTIHTAEGWGVFCDLLAGGESFSGKTVKLVANIEVTRGAGSGSGSDLTANDHPFCGTFDGGGKTLTFNYGENGTPANDDYIAPFRYVNNATIEHLHVGGNIYTSHTHSAGIVGLAYGTTNITDCRSSVNIISSINGDGTHGGIMACSWTGSETNITGCLFDGSIRSATNYTTNQCGGFVGWRNGTINVSNSLLTATFTNIEGSTGDYPSATFVRRGNANAFTNCFYTAAFGTVQGKAPRSVTAGDSVTISRISYTGSHTTYGCSDIIAFTGGGLQHGGLFYYGNGDQVGLELSNTVGEVPAGYTVGYVASVGTLGVSDNSYTLTLADGDATILAGIQKTGEPVSISFVKVDGTTGSMDAIALDGTESSLTAGNYFVGIDINYSSEVFLNGNVNLLLVDGKKMTVATTGDTHGIDGNGHTLTIFGQAAGTGELSVTTSGSSGPIANNNGIINIHGGTVSAVNTGTSNASAIYVDGTNADMGVFITGGTVTADGGTSGRGLYSRGTISITGGKVTARGKSGIVISTLQTTPGSLILGCTKANDFITVSSISRQYNSCTVAIADGQTLSDGTNNYTGTLTSDEITALAGKTLRQINPALTAAPATIFSEPKYVTTFYHGTLDYQLPEGAKAYTANLDGSKVVFHQIGVDGRVIPHGTAAIVVADTASLTLATTTTDVKAYAGNILQGSDTAIPKPAGTVYVLNVDSDGALGFYTFSGSSLPAGKAYYVVE